MAFLCRSHVLGLSLLAALQIGIARAEWTATFATRAEGQRLLAQRDEHIAQMSPFDRSARMKTDREVSVDEFLAFASGTARAWREEDRRAVEGALRDVAPAISRLLPTLKGTIHLITTSGDEEAGLPYTRGSSIVLPAKELQSDPHKLRRTIAHEMFHVFSRQHPHLRDGLYASVGFKPCSVELPAALKPRKITNPDAPVSRHCIGVQAAGKPVQALPVLFARTPKYDPSSGGSFFDYLVFALVLAQEPPSLARVEEVSGFFEQVGRNTQYIIHPEEIVADNFALLALGQANVPSPEVLQRISNVLKQASAR
jgi:hypothetical protein